MIASPNPILGIYDGDGNGPPGSAEAQAFFEDYFTNHDYNFTSVAFDGRSDYGPFLKVGVASGGLFTGAEKRKTTQEALDFGGTAGIAYDVNYHHAGDNVRILISATLGSGQIHSSAALRKRDAGMACITLVMWSHTTLASVVDTADSATHRC